jgi:hypothetical protein
MHCVMTISSAILRPHYWSTLFQIIVWLLVAQDAWREPSDNPRGGRHRNYMHGALKAAIKQRMPLILCRFKTFKSLAAAVLGKALDN